MNYGKFEHWEIMQQNSELIPKSLNVDITALIENYPQLINWNLNNFNQNDNHSLFIFYVNCCSPFSRHSWGHLLKHCWENTLEIAISVVLSFIKISAELFWRFVKGITSWYLYVILFKGIKRYKAFYGTVSTLSMEIHGTE